MATIQSTESMKRSQGGRHRIFTAEQRKDRNRLAQAAFRERRSQYTSTLENTVVELEAIIRELQESNRNTSKRAEEAEQHCAQLTTESLALRQLLAAVVTENQRLLAAAAAAAATATATATDTLSALPSLSADATSLRSLTSPASSTFSTATPSTSPSPTTLLSSPSDDLYRSIFHSEDTAILYQALFPQLPRSTEFGPDTFVDNDGQVKAYLG